MEKFGDAITPEIKEQEERLRAQVAAKKQGCARTTAQKH
jgi:hypothetical protein